MKKTSIILSILALALAFSCEKEETGEELTSVVLVKEIELSFDDTVTAKVYTDENGDSVYPMKVGESTSLSYNISPSADELTSKDIRWSSSNESVATVDENGTVTAVAAGEAGISVQQYPFSATAVATLKVKVFETAVAATSITISVPEGRETDDNGNPIVYEGEEIQLSATVGPDDCTYKTVTWSVDDTSLATIDSIDGTLTGVSAGNIVVTATGVVDTDVTATLQMYVAQSIDPEGVLLTEPDGPISVSDGTYKITYSTYPSVCTKSRIEWASSDEEVATVEKGVVTIKKYGEVEITATCPDGEGGDGMEASSTITLSIPAGYYHEHLENPDLWIIKTSGATKQLLTSDAGEPYLYIVPNKANANTGRGDFGHAGITYVSRQYPIITIRVDDVHDRQDETGNGVFARNINLDTSGTSEDGTKFSGNVGGNNNKWYKKIACADGSSILIYDLSQQSFSNGGVFPENTAGTFGTWQIKYADIRNADKSDIQNIENLSYRFFWHHTFTSMDELDAYLLEWYEQYGIDYEGRPGAEPEPDPQAGVKFALTSDIASITDTSYEVDFTTSPEGTELVWTSSNEEVATVVNGVVTLKGVLGSADITATVSGEGEAPEGYARNATLTLTVPAGYYHEHMENEELWKCATSGSVTEFLTSEAGEKYLSVVPNKAKADTGRGDLKRQESTLLNRAYPIITFRVDDLNDYADETGVEGNTFSRNITLDTSGKGDDNNDYKGGIGGKNQKWSQKYKCSDGSAILVYDLSEKAFDTGGILPEGVTATLTTFQIKYADIRNSDKSEIQDITHMTYRYFWFHTFASMDDLNTYLASWSTQTGISYE